MTLQDYYKCLTQFDNYEKANIKYLRDKKLQYIKEHAPHPIGAIVTVLDCKKEVVLRIKDYEIKNGVLIPKFVSLLDKEQFVSTRAVIKE